MKSRFQDVSVVAQPAGIEDKARSRAHTIGASHTACLVQFGCGTSTAPGWRNYDASPTLYLQRLPVIGGAFRRVLPPLFPSDARFGDILSRLPHADNSVDLVYCSHVLEHLCLEDLRKALHETRRIL